jgi:hypothetical protein
MTLHLIPGCQNLEIDDAYGFCTWKIMNIAVMLHSELQGYVVWPVDQAAAVTGKTMLRLVRAGAKRERHAMYVSPEGPGAAFQLIP